MPGPGVLCVEDGRCGSDRRNRDRRRFVGGGRPSQPCGSRGRWMEGPAGYRKLEVLETRDLGRSRFDRVPDARSTFGKMCRIIEVVVEKRGGSVWGGSPMVVPWSFWPGLTQEPFPQAREVKEVRG